MEFDRQASSFDRRAGLPPGAGERIVAGLLALVQPARTDLCLEIGAGTGQLGRYLLPHLRYVGLDASYRMLRVFGRRPGFDPRALLVQADADRRWPLAEGCARIVLGARVLHLLHAEHVAAEAARVATAGGAWLLIGQIRRDPDGCKSRLRRCLHELLTRRGFRPRMRQRAHAAIASAVAPFGGTPVEPRALFRWHTTATPGHSLASWQNKQGLAGLELPAPVRTEVLAELEARARDWYGDLERPLRSEESFWLEGARFR